MRISCNLLQRWYDCVFEMLQMCGILTTRACQTTWQGCVGFEMYCATNDQDQKLLDEVHVQVRKNTAGAAIKTRDYTICIASYALLRTICPGALPLRHTP